MADGEGRCVLLGRGAVLPGQMVKLAGRDPIPLSGAALFQKPGETLVATCAIGDEILLEQQALRVQSPSHPEDRFEGVSDIFYNAGITPRQGAADAVKADDDPDLPVLPMKFERGGRRFRRPHDAQADDFLGTRQAAGETIIDPDGQARIAAGQSQRAKTLETAVKAPSASAAGLRRGRGRDGADDDGDRLAKAQLKKRKALEMQGGVEG